MTDDLRRQARAMMDRDAETAGMPRQRTSPAPLVTVPTEDAGTLTVEEAPALLSATFMSRTGGTRPHVVAVGFDGVAWCTCQARTPCWALKAFCRVTGRLVYQ